jgi:Vam6/Vps39-like protein vacuolar protein sorting-associated protein 39
MRLRTIRYLKAFALFELKKYDESMDLFSLVSATPKNVITLFPSIISGDLGVREEADEQDNKSEAGYPPSISSPHTSKGLPEGVRGSLESPRHPKDTESDTGSVISKHTEIASSGPPGK